jgi:hypothetical protein
VRRFFLHPMEVELVKVGVEEARLVEHQRVLRI